MGTGKLMLVIAAALAAGSALAQAPPNCRRSIRAAIRRQ